MSKSAALALVAAAFATLAVAAPASAQVYQVGIDPYAGPVYASPFGTMPCARVQQILQQEHLRRMAEQEAWNRAANYAGTSAGAAAAAYTGSPHVGDWVNGRVNGNVRGAGRETTVLNQTIRAGTGVSVRDIEQHGLAGGPNSVFNCPFGGC